MKYKFHCDVKASDLWKMSLGRIYRSMPGIVNVVFTIAMILLTLRFWGTAPDLLKPFLILGCILFPVIQPLAIYGRSAKQLEDLPKDMDLSFDDKGIHVQADGKSEDIRWNKVTNAIRQKDMVVILSDDRHGYMLTNRVLGQDKEAFYNYLCSKIRN